MQVHQSLPYSRISKLEKNCCSQVVVLLISVSYLPHLFQQRTYPSYLRDKISRGVVSINRLTIQSGNDKANVICQNQDYSII